MIIPERASIVVLHGAMGSAATMKPLVDELERFVRVRAIDLIAHGGRPIPERLSIPDMADDALAQIGESDGTPTFVFGYSAGALVALRLARYTPERFAGMCTLAAKYVFDQTTIAHWTHAATPERLKRPELKRDSVLAERHAPQDWTELADVICRMFRDWALHPPVTTEELQRISLPALMFCSDKDQLVSVDETRALGALIPNSSVVFFRGQSHPLEIVPVAPIAKAIGDWIGQVSAAPA
ncbi:MAG: alpha/beta fold hydrolase [Vulcanimicrobiaceae bacterium]